MAISTFTARDIKTGLAILAASVLGIYLGYTVGLSLIAAGLNPVGAGFLAAFITIALIAALSLLFWGIFVKGPERWAMQKSRASYLDTFSGASPRSSLNLVVSPLSSSRFNKLPSGGDSDDEIEAPKSAWWRCT